MMTGLIAMYRKGAITADHVAAECLHLVDPENPALVLDSLPDEILMRMLEYARKYQRGEIVSNYTTVPAIDQVDAAKAWIEEFQSSKKVGSLSSGAD